MLPTANEWTRCSNSNSYLLFGGNLHLLLNQSVSLVPRQERTLRGFGAGNSALAFAIDIPLRRSTGHNPAFLGDISAVNLLPSRAHRLRRRKPPQADVHEHFRAQRMHLLRRRRDSFFFCRRFLRNKSSSKSKNWVDKSFTFTEAPLMEWLKEGICEGKIEIEARV